MSSNNMKNRINYYGGSSQIDRMNRDKLHSLKKALLASYQAATAILSGGREFRCLINPNKLSLDLDNKIISIPFKGVCLNGTVIDIDDPSNQSDEGDWENMLDLTATLTYVDQWENMVAVEDVGSLPDVDEDVVVPGEVVETGIKEGDVIVWKENGSHWLVYLRRLEETAYFRADIRRCRYQLTLGNGSKYWAYVKGPSEKSIDWMQGRGTFINKLNESLLMYITQNEETKKYFSRFKRVMINNLPWEVQVVDSITTPGVLTISLKESYTNTSGEDIEKMLEKVSEKEEIEEQEGVYIAGPATVYPYDSCSYELKNLDNPTGKWEIYSLKNNIVKVSKTTNTTLELLILTGKSGEFTISYIQDDLEVAYMDVEIGSL